MPSASDVHHANRKRRSDGEAQTGTSSEATPPAEGTEHRKKRRNRTTQSCLNCHTSKRMCDRRRPACSRCTQLGLTGLCVYEVDDPNQRADAQDETARLITRVAELEGVIREAGPSQADKHQIISPVKRSSYLGSLQMKNRPDPRWVQGPSGSHPTEVTPDMWIHRSHQRGQSDVSNQQSSRSSSPTSSGTTSEASSYGAPYSQASTSHQPTSIHFSNTYSSTPVEPVPTSAAPSHVRLPYQSSSSSPLVSTPVEEYVRQPTVISNGDYDLAAMLLSYQPTYGSYDEYGGASRDSVDGYPHLANSDQTSCGCAEETPTYSVLLELSVRLRKAADMMSRNPSHTCSGNCSLHRQIAELDRYLSSLLGSVAPARRSLANDIPSVFSSQTTQNGTSSYDPSYQSRSSIHNSHQMVPSSSPVAPLINGLQTWDISGQHQPSWCSATRT